MTYDRALETRIDGLTSHWGLSKKRMFAGLTYFIDGKICFAVRGSELMIRVDKTQVEKLIQQFGLMHAVMGQRVMKNWLQTGNETIADNERLLELLSIGRDNALTTQ